MKLWLGVEDRQRKGGNIVKYRLTPDEKVSIWNHITFSESNIVQLNPELGKRQKLIGEQVKLEK